MSLTDKFDAVVLLIKEHNAVVGTDQPGYVNPDDFLKCIKAQGGTNEDRLKDLSHEEILDCLPTFKSGNTTVQPKSLAKQIAKIFRGKVESVVDENSPRPVSAKKASNMTLYELVQAFDPEDSTSPVGKRLQEVSKGQPFIVYSQGRTIDVESTVKLLKELRDFGPRETYEVNGEIKEIYAVGELPDNYADENPLYPNRPLRPDGYCDQLNRSWEGVPLRVRQLIRLVLQVEGLTISGSDGRERAHNLMDLALETDAFNSLRKRYHKAAVEFDKLAKTNKLPPLTIALGRPVAEAKKGAANRPFDKGHRVTWKRVPGVDANYQFVKEMANLSAQRWSQAYYKADNR